MRSLFALLLFTLCLVGCNKGDDPFAINNSGKSYKVGELYSVGGVLGIVYKVDKSGKSGMIVSLTEPESLLSWSTELRTTNATSHSSGADNMATITSSSVWSIKYPAFVWCKSLGEGWYLPAIDQLKELSEVVNTQKFKKAISTYAATPFTGNARYLSSTEMDQYWVYLLNISDKTQSGNYKQYPYHVRAVRAF